MKKTIYSLSILLSLAFSTYLYFNYSKNQVDTFSWELLILCYVPLVFGLYGFANVRIKKSIQNEENIIKHLISKKDLFLTSYLVFIAIINGIIGMFFFIFPLSLANIKSKNFDIKVAYLATFFWIILLFGILMYTSPNL